MLILFLAACAGLVTTGVDYISLISHELSFIWKTRPRLTFVKVLYLIARYLGLGAQCVNCILTGVWTLNHPVFPPQLCRPWVIYQTVITYLLLGVVNIILMLRVYALYDRSYKILCILAIIFLGKVAVDISTAVIFIPHSDHHFDARCLITKGRPAAPYFVAAEISCQAILLLSVYAKAGWRSGLTDVPILKVVILDSSMVMGATCAGLLATVIYSFKSNDVAVFVYPAFVSILSSAGCRMIINVLRLRDPARSRSPHTTGEFSSLGTWEIDTAFCITTSTSTTSSNNL